MQKVYTLTCALYQVAELLYEMKSLSLSCTNYSKEGIQNLLEDVARGNLVEEVHAGLQL